MHRLVIALTTLLALTAGAYLAGYLLLFSGATDRAAGMLPARTAVYVNVYLRPSPGQQMNLAGLVGRLPGFADEASLDQKVDQVVQNLLAQTDIDYATELKPWLGDQVAVGMWFTEDDPAAIRTVALAAVKDRAAAESALAGIISRGVETPTEETHQGVVIRTTPTGAYAFVDGMLVIGDLPESVRAVIDTAAGGPDLGERRDFRAGRDDLDADHLASAFVDLEAVGSASGIEATLVGGTSAAAVLVAERDGLRLSATSPLVTPQGASAAPQPTDPGASTVTEWMPSDTIAEMVAFDLSALLTDAEAAARGTPQGRELTSALDTLRAFAALGLGIDLDADVLPLLNGEVGLAIGGLREGLPTGQLLLRPDDPEAGIAALDRIADRLAAAGGTASDEVVDGTEITLMTVPEAGEFAYAASDGVLILGLALGDVSAAASAYSDGTSLAASAAYRGVFELAGGRSGTEAYADVSALVDLLVPPSVLPPDARDILAQIGSFGLTSAPRDDRIEFHAVLTIDEAGAQ